MNFTQRRFQPKTIKEALSSELAYQFNSGRNIEMEKLSEMKENKLNLLRTYSSQIFQQLLRK